MFLSQQFLYFFTYFAFRIIRSGFFFFFNSYVFKARLPPLVEKRVNIISGEKPIKHVS